MNILIFNNIIDRRESLEREMSGSCRKMYVSEAPEAVIPLDSHRHWMVENDRSTTLMYFQSLGFIRHYFFTILYFGCICVSTIVGNHTESEYLI